VWIAYSSDYGNLTSEVGYNHAKSTKQDMKIISNNYWQDMKSFVEQISIKFGSFYLINMNLVQTVL